MAHPNRWRALGPLALGLLIGCFESSVTPTTSDDPSSGEPPGGACIPGETQACLCVGGGEGVQVCNEEGAGYGPCECVATTTAATSGSTGPVDETTSGPSGTTMAVDGTDSGSTDTGVLESGPDTTPGGNAYGPCFEGCGMDEVCVSGEVMGTGVCAPPCMDIVDCPESPPGSGGDAECIEIQGGTYCALLCTGDNGCPMGMTCSGICVWPE